MTLPNSPDVIPLLFEMGKNRQGGLTYIAHGYAIAQPARWRHFRFRVRDLDLDPGACQFCLWPTTAPGQHEIISDAKLSVDLEDQASSRYLVQVHFPTWGGADVLYFGYQVFLAGTSANAPSVVRS